VALRTLTSLCALLLAGCGGFSLRAGLGPSLDAAGNTGLEAFVEGGFRMGDLPLWATVQPVVELEGERAFTLRMANQWVQPPRPGFWAQTLSDRPPVRVPAQHGLRIGGGFGVRLAPGYAEPLVALVAGWSYPMTTFGDRTTAALGAQLACSAAAGGERPGAERVWCHLAPTVELIGVGPVWTPGR
jgi:hypothetical protein